MVNYCRKVQHIFLEIVLGLDIKIFTIVDLKWWINYQRVDKEIKSIFGLLFVSKVPPDMSQKNPDRMRLFPNQRHFNIYSLFQRFNCFLLRM